jgi:uncharacterized protein (DUF885 family)
LIEIARSRPGPAVRPGALDERLYDLVEARFRRVIEHDPTTATSYGIHAWDDQLGDGSRDAVLDEIEQDRRHLAAVEALDPAGLSPEASFERDLELHHVRETLFHAEEVRTWERRSFALDGLGDALFLLMARDFAPLPERLLAIAGRLEGVPAFLAQHRTRAVVPQVRVWQQLEVEEAAHLRSFLDDIAAAGQGQLAPAEQGRLDRAVRSAGRAIADYAGWLRGTLARGTDAWALGRERLDALIAIRALEDLTSEDILQIGFDQLALQQDARRAAAHRIDPGAHELEVVERVKGDQPGSFDDALEAYRSAMLRARAHIVEHDLATIPPDERIEVIPTPLHLRQSLPLAAYFQPPKFDRDPAGIYVVTPSVDADPAAMREHNRSAISNTSIHEAYPGHHLQLVIARTHPSLSRLQLEATEFVEGWAMYCEQMMREHGFDDGPVFQVGLATDAIWRACRVVLDIQMHRGELSIQAATKFLQEMTRFERSVAHAEVVRYTYTPTYQLSYLLGKVMILQLRDDEQRRLGSAFNLRAFHDTLLANGSLPVSFHRRAMAGAGSPAGATAPQPGVAKEGSPAAAS